MLASLSLVCAVEAFGQELLDHLQDELTLKDRSGNFHADLTCLFDLEGYYIDQRPPGLLYKDESFFNGRATFFLDVALGKHLYTFLQARLDQGFDPGWKNFDARLDEYALRWTPLDNSALNFQFGKFATVVGSWVQRHDSWMNPFITAPLPYDTLTTVADDEAPASPQAFLARKNQPDNKDSWAPAVWGPAYTTGWEVFGSVGKLDYAFDFKNAAISSHPAQWDLNSSLWEYPTISGRIGFRPDASWNHGVSFSFGPYLYSEAKDTLPPGHDIGDYDQITVAYDLSYARHHWQLWGELFLTRFQVPNVGNADVLSYYLELKYKFTPKLYGALRWNQQFFGEIPNGVGGDSRWDSNMLRAEVALGYRFTRHFQGKLQYSYGHRDATLQQGEQLVAAQITLSF